MSRKKSDFKVAIIGGGISGIAQAVTLKRQLGKSVNIKVSASITRWTMLDAHQLRSADL
jgi:cation diffusion facilitator CzcD-associated flavoprotein CzcO